MSTVCVIPYSDCLALRHEVLWPNAPIEQSQVPGDDSAEHLGIYRDRELVSCLSVFADGDSVQVRKFATKAALQGQGLGSMLLLHVLDRHPNVWLDARLTATGFYERFGFKQVGEVFLKNKTMQHIRMERNAVVRNVSD